MKASSTDSLVAVMTGELSLIIAYASNTESLSQGTGLQDDLVMCSASVLCTYIGAECISLNFVLPGAIEESFSPSLLY